MYGFFLHVLIVYFIYKYHALTLWLHLFLMQSLHLKKRIFNTDMFARRYKVVNTIQLANANIDGIYYNVGIYIVTIMYVISK